MWTTLVGFLWVGAGGTLGAMSRHGIMLMFDRPMRPLGTLLINVTGSFVLGWFLASIGDRMPVGDPWRLAVATGFVGAYTTFSTYMYETNTLMNDSEWLLATLYLVGSIVLGLAAVRAGIFLGRPAA